MVQGIKFMNNDFFKKVSDSFGKGLNPNEYSPLVLAYIGDSVFEILVRTMVVSMGNAPVNKLHKRSRSYVNAKAQSEMYYKICDFLTEEESAVFKRGRNAKSFTVPKNAELIDYKHATGLEALFGFLYLKSDFERIIELFKRGLENKIEK